MSNDTPLDERVREDHAMLRELFTRFHGARNSHRADVFDELHGALIAHEVAEEVVVLPALAIADPELRDAGAERVAEQSSIAAMLARLARLGTEDWRFDSLFAELESAFDAHALAEEDLLVPALREGLDDAELGRLGRRYARTRDAKGTRAKEHDGRDGARAREEADKAHRAFAITMQRGAR